MQLLAQSLPRYEMKTVSEQKRHSFPQSPIWRNLIKSSLVTSLATVLDLPFQSKAAEVLYPSTVSHQFIHAEEGHLGVNLENFQENGTSPNCLWRGIGRWGPIALLSSSVDLTPLDVLHVATWKLFVFCSDTISISHDSRIEQCIAVVSTETSETCEQI